MTLTPHPGLDGVLDPIGFGEHTPQDALDGFLEWSRAYSYGRVFPVRAVFITHVDGAEFYDLLEADQHDNMLGYGGMPKVAIEYKIGERWVRDDGVDTESFNARIRVLAADHMMESRVNTNLCEIERVYRPGMTADSLARDLARANKVIRDAV